MLWLPRRLLSPVLAGAALALVAAMPSLTMAASPVALGHGTTTLTHPGGIPTHPNAVYHLRGHATCAAGHFLYVNDGSVPNVINGYVINADCSLTPTPGSPYATGSDEATAAWSENQLATSMANGPCVYSTDSGGNGGVGQVVSWSVASDGALTKVSAVQIANGSSSFAGDVHVSADGKFVYAPTWGPSSTLDVLAVGSGCTLTLASTLTASNALYRAIALLGNVGLMALDAANEKIDIYRITGGTKLALVSSTPTQITSGADGAAAILKSPIGPLVFNGSYAVDQTEVHTVSKKGVLGNVPGSPASDPSGSESANVFFDASHGQLIATEQFSNAMGIYGKKGSAYGLLGHVAMSGSDFPTAQSELGSELYVTNELGASVEACALGVGTGTCSVATSLSNFGIAQGIGVL